MGKPRYARKAMLLAGLLYTDDFLQKAVSLLQAEFGEIIRETPPAKWHSDYYSKELGPSIRRKFLFFGRLIDPGDIAEIKIATNKMESDLSKESKRTVNIDPGYITPAKLVLASTKDYSHRVYLGKGIYAESTLLWDAKQKTFVPHLYTYSDFKEEENIRVFSEMREILMKLLTPSQP